MKKKRIKIAPSILSCDFSQMHKEIKNIEAGGADWVHVDVMDGHFVPNITIGVPVVASLAKKTRLPLDVHLMIENPGKFIKPFAKAGSDILTIHIEAEKNAKALLKKIRSLGIKAGLSLRPATPLSKIYKVLDYADMVLVMSVNPGFGGQAFMPVALKKIRALRKIYEGDIQVDGGINPQTAKRCIEAGANILVAGTAVFGKKNRVRAIKSLRG